MFYDLVTHQQVTKYLKSDSMVFKYNLYIKLKMKKDVPKNHLTCTKTECYNTQYTNNIPSIQRSTRSLNCLLEKTRISQLVEAKNRPDS
jgi:hypothetical protein